MRLNQRNYLMSQRVNHQGARMPDTYIRCTHCGKIELVKPRCDETQDAIILPGVCAECFCRILNTGRRVLLRKDWTQVSLKDQLDD